MRVVAASWIAFSCFACAPSLKQVPASAPHGYVAFRIAHREPGAAIFEDSMRIGLQTLSLENTGDYEGRLRVEPGLQYVELASRPLFAGKPRNAAERCEFAEDVRVEQGAETFVLLLVGADGACDGCVTSDLSASACPPKAAARPPTLNTLAADIAARVAAE